MKDEYCEHEHTQEFEDQNVESFWRPADATPKVKDFGVVEEFLDGLRKARPSDQSEHVVSEDADVATKRRTVR